MHALIYLFQVSACTTIFYGSYYFLLRRFTFFAINRWYLLVTLSLSFIIPLLNITLRQQSTPLVVQKVISVNQALPAVVVNAATPASYESQSINWAQLIEVTYLIVTAILLIRLMVVLGSFFYKLKDLGFNKTRHIKVIKGNKLHNGSFFNYIFLNNDGLSKTETERILEHEMLHARFYHSADRVLVKLAQIILWFNPFVYGYAYAIEENHEFEVDAEMGKHADKGAYADMLLHLSVNRQSILFNSFSKAPLKRRITMLFTKPTYHMKKVTYLLVLPVVMISCLAFARFKNDAQKNVSTMLPFAKLKTDIQNKVSKMLPFAEVKNDIRKNKYSVVSGADLLKGEVKVFVDDKPYDTDLLYKISGSCIASSKVTYVSVPGMDDKTVVKIKTRNGDIAYLTPIEKSNLIKERTAKSIVEFYSRVHLNYNNGKPYDKAIVHSLKSATGITIKPDDKIGFLIDGILYNEHDIQSIDPAKIKEIMEAVDISDNYTPGQYVKGFAAIFTIKTAKLQVAGDSTSSKPKTMIRETPQPVTDSSARSMSYSEKQLVQQAFSNPAAPFLSRFHFQRKGGNDFDVVAFKTGNTGGTANLDANEKVGVFIDGKFYNEDAIKKLSPGVLATLVMDSHADRSKFEKIPEGENYAVPFYFKTKTK